jgi:predicted metalloprotease
MRFRRGSQLDTSQVSDRRGAAGGVALGGGGLIGVVVLVLTLLNGGDPSSLNLGTGVGGGTGDNTELSASCKTGEDANQEEDCRIVAVVNSVQEFWSNTLEGYQEAPTVFFSGATQTGCGNATSAVGPFYCPLDQTIYIDLSFYEQLRRDFGATGGPFAEAYVIAHEYAHHVENLQGTLERAQRDRSTGPTSSGVRLELQADCLAGLWARGAEQTGFIEDLTQADIEDGLNAASVIGDDAIQEKMQGQVNPESWTHGSSEQRQRWFLTGYNATRMSECDTFKTGNL